MWRGSQNAKKTKRLDKEEIKNQLIDSLVNNDTSEMEELNEKADKVEKPEDAPTNIKEYEDLIRTKKGILSIPYHQEKVFSHFCKKETFVRLVANFKIHKNTIIFKINIFKLIEKQSKLINSSVTLNFLKNYFKGIKQICKVSRGFE